MPYLAFDDLPPATKTIGTTCANKKAHSTKETLPTVEKLPKKEQPSNADRNPAEDCPSNAYPAVRLDVDTISDAVAGRLATSLLGHVLFLKNQVPFPVMQLGRIPGGKVNSRAFKQRTELLASYDTISSHLDTTFSALSTALARCADNSTKTVAQAHVAILVGPSLGTAKSKVMLGIDGLKTRIWGAREDAVAKSSEGDQECDEVDEDEQGSSADECESSAEEPEESDDEEDDDEREDDSEDEDEGEDGDEEESVEKGTASSPPPPSYISHAEEQKFLQNADRLLSRTLAAADAEGNGISSDMTPTQTHILIRAPRRFTHPAWIPRQNVTAALDNSLHDFMNKSGLSVINSTSPPRHNNSSKKTNLEGVWITARSGIQKSSPVDRDDSGQSEQSPGDDADEMIWWSWDGKFVGFNEW